MIGLVDLLVLSAVSLSFSSRDLYLGVVIFSLGLFYFFQARRSRLLVGLNKKPLAAGRRLRAAAGAVLFSGMSAPLLMDSRSTAEFFEQGKKLDALFPVVILVALLAAALMVGLSVEGRNR